MTAISELAKHLLEDNHGFQYFLTGKLTSASLEGRFGWYHHSNGGNYLTSVKHRPHSEKDPLLKSATARCLVNNDSTV